MSAHSTDLRRTDFGQLKALHFEPVDHERFPAIALAYKVLRKGGLAALTLNAANEVAVVAFLAGKIKLPDIYAVVDKMVTESNTISKPSLTELLEADRQVRKRTEELIASETFIR